MSRTTTAFLAAAALALLIVAVIVFTRRSEPSERVAVEAPATVTAPPAATAPPPNNAPTEIQRSAALPTTDVLAADDVAFEQFKKDVDAFIDIHRGVVKQQPKVSDNATIQEIDRHQRGFLQALAAKRPGARRGELFKPPMETAVRRMLVKVFEGVEGRQLRDSIMDENPSGITIAINGRYPDQVPMATMPPEVLAALPKLPEELEYRFIGEALAILDVPAHLIVDYIPNALPRN